MIITVNNVTKRFGDFVAVDDVSFRVGEGDLVALLGPSGSGKSTILRIIAGLDTPDSGEIFLTGRDVTRLTPQERQVGFVFQHYALFKHMTVEKNIAFGLEIRKRKKAHISERVAELIDLVKLQGYERHYPDHLSGGQRQRVALARSLAAEPKVLLLDEPFGALDAKVRENLAGWLRAFHRRMKITTIFVTHDQSEAIEISDKIIVINNGRVEQQGTARNVYENPESRFVAGFIGQVNVLDAVGEEGRVLIKGTSCAVENAHVEVPSGGDLVVLVRPENIDLQPEATANSFCCRIEKIHYRGSHYDIDCFIENVHFKVVENKSSFAQKNWREGQPAYFSFDSWRVFKADDGHAESRRRLKGKGFTE